MAAASGPSPIIPPDSETDEDKNNNRTNNRQWPYRHGANPFIVSTPPVYHTETTVTRSWPAPSGQTPIAAFG